MARAAGTDLVSERSRSGAVTVAATKHGVRAESAELIRSLFGGRRDVPITGIAQGERLSAEAAGARLTRIRALVARVLGSG